MSDLHQIVDLGALADDGIPGGAAVDGRIGADLHIVLNDDAAGLRDFLMALRGRQIAETVLADARARMDDDAIADQRMLDRRTGADRAVAADAHARPDHRAGRDHRAGADLGIGADDGERIDRHIRFKACRRMHVRVLAASFHAEQRRWAQGIGKQRARDRDEGAIRLGRHQDGQTLRRLGFKARADEAGARARDRQRVEKFGLVEKADVGCDRGVERRDIADAPVERIARSRLGARQRRRSPRSSAPAGLAQCPACARP